MKKLLTVIAVLAVSALIMTGCGGGNTNPAPATTDTPTQTQDTVEANVDTSKFIGEEKAQELALKRAGIAAEDVIFDRIELDREDGVWKYEVEFRKDRTEYDVDIKADDGTILSFEADTND